MKPTQGRIVRYVTHYTSREEWVGIVCGVAGETVNLALFSLDGGLHGSCVNVPYDENKAPGTWHWPPRD
jgi:hypothetical protein